MKRKHSKLEMQADNFREGIDYSQIMLKLRSDANDQLERFYRVKEFKGMKIISFSVLHNDNKGQL